MSITKSTINTKRLLDTFEVYNCHVGNLPDKTELNELAVILERRYYQDIIYRFPEEYITVVLKFFETEEDYITCGIIKNRIENFNKFNGSNIMTNLEECI